MPLLIDQWEDGELSPLDIRFDDQNPRIDPSHRSNQTTILNHLVEWEGVVELAKSISDYRGLFPQEKIIVANLGGEVVVLEGNRRVAACQLLLKPTTSPYKEVEQRIPQCDEVTKRNIEAIPVVFAATRAIADEVIAKLHLNSGKKDWSDIGQFRYAADRYERKVPIEEIADTLQTTSKEIMRYIAYDKIHRFTLSMPVWTEEEKEKLWDFRLNIKNYLKILFSDKTNQHFGVNLVDDFGRPNSAECYDCHEIIGKIARQTLLLPALGNYSYFSENTSISSYLAKNFPKLQKSNALPPGGLFLEGGNNKMSSSGSETGVSHSKGRELEDDGDWEKLNEPEPVGKVSTRQNLRHEKFFEELKCFREDDLRLKQLCRELKRISPYLETLHISAGLLMRAALEWSLSYHLKKVHRVLPGKAALILRKKYSVSLYPYAMRLMTLMRLFIPSNTLVLSR